MTDYFARTLTLAVGLLTLAAPHRAHAQGTPRLTADQVIAMARTYCAALGQPQTGPATTIYPYTAHDDVNNGPLYYLPRWQVSFQNDPEVQIVDATGIVSSFFNGGAMSGNRTDTPAITQEVAIQAAAAAMLASGQSFSELSPTPEANYLGSEYWDITWPRVYQGIPYYGQGAGAEVDGTNGAVIGEGIDFASPPTVSATFNITGDQAVQTALNQLAAVGIQDAVYTNAVQEIVMPNPGAWNGGPTHPDYLDPPVPAWHCYFNTTRDSSEVMVDATTGAFIGGETGGAYGSPKSLAGITTAALKAAVSLQLFTQSKRHQWSKKPAAILTGDQSKHFLAALALAPAWTGKTGPVLDAVRVELTNAKKHTSKFYYYPRLKILGFQGSWVRAPESFQKIVGKLPKA